MKFLEGLGVNTVWIILAAGIAMVVVVFSLFDFTSSRVVGYMIATAPVWLPLVTFKLFYDQWLEYVQKDYDIKQGRITLEIRLPQDVFKSPLAMEQLFSQLWQTASPDNHVQTYWDGKNPPTYSLELVSRNGAVSFYINTPIKKFKNLIESQLYAQYPGVEVQPLSIDYTAEIPWQPERYQYFSFHFGLKKADAYPIKTYVDYGLDKFPKEEEKTDPMMSVIEFLGSLGQGEHMWVQILMKANYEKNFKSGALFTQPDWKAAAQAEIDKILEVAQKRTGAEQKNMMQLTDLEKDTVNAIQRSLGKFAFNTGIRAVYIAEKDKYQPGERLPGILSSWTTFTDINRNAIGFKWRTDFDWNWWQDPSGKIREDLKKIELKYYKLRKYYSHVLSDEMKVMTTEELATIYHLPGRVALTPSLARIPSKRAEPPANLPIVSN